MADARSGSSTRLLCVPLIGHHLVDRPRSTPSVTAATASRSLGPRRCTAEVGDRGRIGS